VGGAARPVLKSVGLVVVWLPGVACGVGSGCISSSFSGWPSGFCLLFRYPAGAAGFVVAGLWCFSFLLVFLVCQFFFRSLGASGLACGVLGVPFGGSV
jgi:hypothetical protein